MAVVNKLLIPSYAAASRPAIPNLHRRVAGTLRREPGVLRLHGWQYAVLAAYAILAIGYFGIIGEQLATASLWLVHERSAFAMQLAAIARRTLTAPTALAAMSRVLQLVYTLARPLLLLAGWIFLLRQAMRLFRPSRPENRSLAASTVALSA